MPSDRAPSGYRPEPGPGPRLRSDVVEVMVFRIPTGPTVAPELLQIRRAKPPLMGTWQPVMGHIEAGETAVQAALRELREETGLDTPASAPGGGLSSPPAIPSVPLSLPSASVPSCFLAMWSLEQVHPYFIAAIDSIVLPARFAVHAAPAWSPTLNHEHSQHRWIVATDAPRWFMWPGQAAAARELIDHILASPPTTASLALRVR